MCPLGPAVGIDGIGLEVPRCPFASRPRKTCAVLGVCLRKEDNDFHVELFLAIPAALEEFWCMYAATKMQWLEELLSPSAMTLPGTMSYCRIVVWTFKHFEWSAIATPQCLSSSVGGVKKNFAHPCWMVVPKR